MIPFEDLVASLERFKLRKSTPSAVPVQNPGKAVSGKQQAQKNASLAELADLLPEE